MDLSFSKACCARRIFPSYCCLAREITSSFASVADLIKSSASCFVIVLVFSAITLTASCFFDIISNSASLNSPIFANNSLSLLISCCVRSLLCSVLSLAISVIWSWTSSMLFLSCACFSLSIPITLSRKPLSRFVACSTSASRFPKFEHIFSISLPSSLVPSVLLR